MAITRNGSSSSENGMSAEEIREMIITEVGRVIADTLPVMFAGMREELLQILEERAAATPVGRGGQPPARSFVYKDFQACNPPLFKGETDPIVSLRWLADVEGVFRISECPEHLRVRYATNLLRGAAKDWWGMMGASMTTEALDALNWADFCARFRAQYVPQVEVDRITREFLALEQTTESVTEMTRKFTEMVQFVPHYAAESLKMTRYADMLRTEIREFVNASQFTTLAALIEAARRRELELEAQARKRKGTSDQSAVYTSTKRSKTSDFRQGQKKGGQRTQSGSPGGNTGCYRCGQPGHMSRDCRQPVRVCYGCGKTGHLRSDCPSMKTGRGAPRAPVTTPLPITSGRPGQAVPPRASGRAFQLTSEEVKIDPKVVAGTRDTC